MDRRTMLSDLNYVDTFNQQQDKYVDNRTTMGQGMRTGNTLVDMVDSMIGDQALVDVSGMLGGPMPLVNNLRKALVPSRLSRAQEAAQWAKGADSALVTNGVPDTLYHGFKNPKPDMFPIGAERRAPKHQYQKDGYRFATRDPEFAGSYSSETMLSPMQRKSLEKFGDTFADELNAVPLSGEGNMMGVQFRNKKVFDPDNTEHLDELANYYDKIGEKIPSPMLSDAKKHRFQALQHKDTGWADSENKAIFNFLDEAGYDGQFIWEDGIKSLMTKEPSLVRNIFDVVDLTNSNYRKGINSVGVSFPAGLNLGGQYGE